VILADSSAWIESSVDQRIQHLIATEAPLAVTEPVVMEVLAGARDDAREADLRRLLLRHERLASIRSSTSRLLRRSTAAAEGLAWRHAEWWTA
jgi:predicted nucleic acid-binding protein